MERVTTLIKKLQQQLDSNATPSMLLHTAQMLQAELQSSAEPANEINQNKVAVILPRSYFSFDKIANGSSSEKKITEEKIIEVLQVDEKEIEEELEQIKKNAEAMNAMGSHAKPQFIYDDPDPVDDIPTLAHQTPLKKTQPKNEIPFAESLNDKLKEQKTELSDKLTEVPIKDLKKAIGVNDRFLFINELFRGDEAMFERSIKTIQNFSILAEAEFWIRRELKVKTGWKDSDPIVKQFDQLVKRRFA